ncbi:hypothetical protein C6946_24110 [Burkholderia thailandensis]|nr:hypothetical protein C6946_24110 [Burkholderia thailandensis]
MRFRRLCGSTRVRRYRTARAPGAAQPGDDGGGVRNGGSRRIDRQSDASGRSQAAARGGK